MPNLTLPFFETEEGIACLTAFYLRAAYTTALPTKDGTTALMPCPTETVVKLMMYQDLYLDKETNLALINHFTPGADGYFSGTTAIHLAHTPCPNLVWEAQYWGWCKNWDIFNFVREARQAHYQKGKFAAGYGPYNHWTSETHHGFVYQNRFDLRRWSIRYAHGIESVTKLRTSTVEYEFTYQHGLRCGDWQKNREIVKEHYQD